jgi:hypothetical protein
MWFAAAMQNVGDRENEKSGTNNQVSSFPEDARSEV